MMKRKRKKKEVGKEETMKKINMTKPVVKQHVDLFE